MLAEEGDLGPGGFLSAVAQREKVPALFDAVELSAGDLARRVLGMAEGHVAIVCAVHDQRRAAHLVEGQLFDGAELFDIVVESGAEQIEGRSIGQDPSQVRKLLWACENIGGHAGPLRRTERALDLQ